MPISIGELLSDLTADTATIRADRPGGLYDKIHQFLEQSEALPKSKGKRITVIAVALLAQRIVKQQLSSGPIKNFLSGLSASAIRQEARRILDHVDQHPGQRYLADERPDEPTRGPEAIWEMDEGARKKLLEQFAQLDEQEQQQARKQMLRSTAEQLAKRAGLSPDEHSAVITLLNEPSLASSFAESARKNGQTLVDRLNGWSDRLARW